VPARGSGSQAPSERVERRPAAWYSVARKKDLEARLRAMKSFSFTTPQGSMP